MQASIDQLIIAKEMNQLTHLHCQLKNDSIFLADSRLIDPIQLFFPYTTSFYCRIFKNCLEKSRNESTHSFALPTKKMVQFYQLIPVSSTLFFYFLHIQFLSIVEHLKIDSRKAIIYRRVNNRQRNESTQSFALPTKKCLNFDS